MHTPKILELLAKILQGDVMDKNTFLLDKEFKDKPNVRPYFDVLRFLRDEGRKIHRSELMKKLKISESTFHEIIKCLCNWGWVRNVGGGNYAYYSYEEYDEQIMEYVKICEEQLSHGSYPYHPVPISITKDLVEKVAKYLRQEHNIVLLINEKKIKQQIANAFIRAGYSAIVK